MLSDSEVRQIFDQHQGVHLVIAKLLYGCGLRISESLRLRVIAVEPAAIPESVFQDGGESPAALEALNRSSELHEVDSSEAGSGELERPVNAIRLGVANWCKQLKAGATAMIFLPSHFRERLGRQWPTGEGSSRRC